MRILIRPRACLTRLRLRRSGSFGIIHGLHAGHGDLLSFATMIFPVNAARGILFADRDGVCASSNDGAPIARSAALNPA
jgi:hypothetical protein